MKLRNTSGVIFFFLLIMLLFTGGVFAQTENQRPAQWAQPVSLSAAANFYKITDELYRAAQPTAEAMRAYEAFGIRTVINLRSFHSDKDEIAGTNLILVELPTHAWSDGDDGYIIEVLRAIRTAEKPVLVHCQHGADRTGMVIAMYRIIEQGWSRADALNEMQNGGYGFHSIWQNIPTYINSADINKISAALVKGDSNTP